MLHIRFQLHFLVSALTSLVGCRSVTSFWSDTYHSAVDSSAAYHVKDISGGGQLLPYFPRYTRVFSSLPVDTDGVISFSTEKRTGVSIKVAGWHLVLLGVVV